MIIDLIHNKIVAGTITPAFERSVKENLVPMLVKKYGKTEIVGIQMYEDYLNREDWTRRSLINIAKGGFFAADRSIEEYAQRIWGLEKIK